MLLAKYINKTTLVTLILALSASSCSDFLDVAPTSELESVYFENENRIQRGIGAIYARDHKYLRIEPLERGSHPPDVSFAGRRSGSERHQLQQL